MSSIIKEVKKVAEPLLEHKGFELVDLQYGKEGGNWKLRFLIDKPEGGVTIGNCQEISDMLDIELDNLQLIDRAYVLEVASPGLDRPLVKNSDFDRFAGEKVKIKTYAPVSGRKNFTGILKGFIDNEVVIDTEDGESFSLPRNKIAKANLVPEIDFSQFE